MLRPINARVKREIRKREVSRSFRCPPAVDKLLDEHAARKGWTKSFLIRDILHSWFTYQQAKKKVE